MMRARTLTSIGLVLAILGSLAWLYFTLRPKGLDLNPYEVLGGGAGNETARLLQNSGSVVLVDADFGIYKLLAPTTEAAIKAFKKAMARTSMRLAAIEKVPIVPPSMTRNGIFMQPGQLSGLIARHPQADAIILFVGLAGLGDLNGLGVSKGKPKLVLVSNYESYVRSLVQKRVIELAIAPRAGVDPDQDAAIHSRQELFERHYEVLRPEPEAASGK